MWRVSVLSWLWVILCVHFACSQDVCNYVNYLGDSTHKAVGVLEPLLGKSYDCVDRERPTIHYTVGICKDLSKDPNTNVGALQVIRDKISGNITTHSVGSIDQTDFLAGTNFVKLEYRSGDNYGHHCGGGMRRALLFIICDESESQGRLEHIEENNEKEDECYYLFELSHRAVCKTNSTAVEPQQLGLGSIVSIVFFVMVGVYLLGGFAYQRFVNHAVGKEQIPNYAFWQDVGNLAADGCSLVFRSDGRSGETRQYRGIGDDQLRNTAQEDPPSDTDEHLLPM